MEEIYSTRLSKQEIKDLIDNIENDESRIKLYFGSDKFVYDCYKKIYDPYYEREDILGELRLGLWKGIKSFDKSKGFEYSTYIYRCMINSVLMYYRSNKKHKIYVACSGDDYMQAGNDLVPLKDTFEDPIDHFNEIFMESYEDLTKGITGRDKAILDYKYIQGKSQTEIGHIIGLSQPQVSRIVRRNILKIKKEYFRMSKDAF